jgi:hypothetical protein
MKLSDDFIVINLKEYIEGSRNRAMEAKRFRQFTPIPDDFRIVLLTPIQDDFRYELNSCKFKKVIVPLTPYQREELERIGFLNGMELGISEQEELNKNLLLQNQKREVMREQQLAAAGYYLDKYGVVQLRVEGPKNMSIGEPCLE